MKHLVIPDPHCTPEVSNERFDWLGKLILDERPDTIVCLGDFACMPSLSSYDKGKKSFEGRRYNKDVIHTHDALMRVSRYLSEYNGLRRQYKEKQYRPRFVMLGGNHDEERIKRLVEATAELDGVISISDLCYEDYGWEYVPYKVPVVIDGISYCHHFASGVKGLPIGGFNMGRALLKANHQSSTVGHSHIWSEAEETRADGKKMYGLSAGCYFEHDPDFARGSCKFWWRGVVIKENVKDGEYDLRRISIKTLRKKYSHG